MKGCYENSVKAVVGMHGPKPLVQYFNFQCWGRRPKSQRKKNHVRNTYSSMFLVQHPCWPVLILYKYRNCNRMISYSCFPRMREFLVDQKIYTIRFWNVLGKSRWAVTLNSMACSIRTGSDAGLWANYSSFFFYLFLFKPWLDWWNICTWVDCVPWSCCDR